MNFFIFFYNLIVYSQILREDSFIYPFYKHKIALIMHFFQYFSPQNASLIKRGFFYCAGDAL